MNETLQSMMREATRLTQTGNLREATQLIQRALGKAGPATMPVPPNFANSDPIILDGCVFEVEEPAAARPETNPSSAAWRDSSLQGEFASGTHTHASLTRRYKLFSPPGSVGKNLPLVVMLHGCTQNPDDFAAGTGMNERASQQGFYVLYPEQSASGNPQRCWNWFKHNHQSRGKGEAALLASMTLAVMAQRGIDARRVYIAGLSAGGAMAAIVAAAYPDIFAAVGVHSGLAVGAAGNVAQALAAMKSGAANIKAAPSQVAVPTIVFHGDQDHTVHPRNGAQVIAALQAGADKCMEEGVSNNGQRFTRTQYRINQVNFAEHWLVHGGGHAWSGGNAKGSCTDPKGPDASSEMLRFFSEHVKCT
jgi:poly(hydroxyalkanoate) depolymerase family esterase